MSLDDVKYDVAMANRMMTEVGLANGVLVSLGHASMRIPDAPDTFVVKGRGYALDALPRMRAEDMIVCDLEGYLVGGPDRISQVSEVKIHSCIYRDNPEVQAIVHAHPRFTVLMSVLGQGLVPMCKEGFQLVADEIPVYPHMKIVNSDEEGTALAAVLGDSPVAVMTGHGAVTAGSSLEEALINMMLLEEQAKMNWYACCALGPNHPRIADELIDEARNAPGFWDLPHFRATHTSGKPRRDGLWKHYMDLVADDGGR